jgi:hypothetical protein
MITVTEKRPQNPFDALAAYSQTGELDFATLAALRGDEDGPVERDHPCPLCGPERSTHYNRTRRVLRTWQEDPEFIRYYCVRCGAQGYALADDEELERQLLLPRKPKRKKVSQPRNVDLEYVEGLWRGATSRLPQNVVDYFHWRGIDCAAVPKGVLRYHASCPVPGGARNHCLLARYSDALTGELKGLWRRPVFHNVVGDLYPKPTTLGPMSRCVIRLFPEIGKKLVVAEGVETALTAATRVTYRGELLSPAWATGCANNMRHLRVIDGVEQLIIVADNDASGTGLAAARECARRWRDAGREVVCLMPEKQGTDLNDLVRT